MSVLDRRHELFINLVRLRRAGRALPGNQDIAAVPSALESQLGDTLSQRLAGRILGVSHTALERWIKEGDLPVVFSARGRAEIPVPALLDHEIDGSLGDGSQFHRTFGYYAHGSAQRRPRHRPVGVRAWFAFRCRRESSRSPVAWCLDVHDLVLSKCVAGRDRGWEFAAEALRCALVDEDVLLSRAGDLPVAGEARAHIRGRLGTIVATIRSGAS